MLVMQAGHVIGEMDDFELMTRTSNDASSIKGRYQILRRHFEEFLR